MPELWTFSESKEAARKEAQAAELASLRQRGFRVYAWDDLRDVGDGWLADSEDRLWRLANGEPLNGHQPDTSAAALGRGFVLTPEASGVSGAPHTLAQLQQQQAAREAAEAESLRQARAALEGKRKQAVPLTAARLEGAPRSLTLAQAADAVDAAAGRLEVRDGRLIVALPASAFPDAQRAAAVLYRAEEVVVAALKAKRSLPDREVTGAGALL